MWIYVLNVMDHAVNPWAGFFFLNSFPPLPHICHLVSLPQIKYRHCQIIIIWRNSQDFFFKFTTCNSCPTAAPPAIKWLMCRDIVALHLVSEAWRLFQKDSMQLLEFWFMLIIEKIGFFFCEAFGRPWYLNCCLGWFMAVICKAQS